MSKHVYLALTYPAGMAFDETQLRDVVSELGAEDHGVCVGGHTATMYFKVPRPMHADVAAILRTVGDVHLLPASLFR